MTGEAAARNVVPPVKGDAAVAVTASHPELDLAELDATVERAIRAGVPNDLRVLGFGEITLVVGWPTELPALAVKRLPLFRDVAQLERYAEILNRYVGALRKRGVPVVPTEIRRATSPTTGSLHGYLVQAIVPAEQMLNVVLRDADHARGERLLSALAAMIAESVDTRVGLDAQAANWAVEGEELATVDVSTPLLRDAGGRDQLDLDLFLSIYPWGMRPALARIAHGIMAQYHDPRTVLVDVASNLIKERHERWLPALLEAANRRVTPAITDREVRRYFARDRRLWLLMQRLRRADRAWQRHVRRRPYPFLLPPPYGYGPPETPSNPRSPQ
jgi:hypothetical protein